MRKIKDLQFKIGEVPISEIQFDPKSRDDIPQLLRGLQHIYMTPSTRQEVFGILEEMIPAEVDKANGRPGMELWKVFPSPGVVPSSWALPCPSGRYA